MGNRHKWAEENKGEKRKRATRGNKTAAIVTTARERKETDNNPGSCVRSVSGLMKIYMKKGGRDRHHLHEETKTGRTRYLHEVIFLFMPLFCSLCSSSAIRFCSNALGETSKHVSKTGVTPPPRRLPQDRRLRSLRNRTVTSLGSPLAVGGWEKPLNHRRPDTQSTPALMQWCMTAAGSWRAPQIDLQAFDNSSLTG